jgi:oligopeptide transport system ATP-binding protein
MIFQDPTSSLNGHMTVRDIIAEGLKNYPHIYNTKENKIHAQIYFNKKQDEDFKKLEEYQRHIKTYIETSSVHYKENLEKYNKLKHKYDHEKFDDKYLLDYTITQIIKKVGLLPEHLNRYPHEFSGGQKQRIGIARAIALKPSLIIADEPISALDMSIRSQILNLFNTFKKELGFGCIFITHDLNAVKYIADRIAVIYHGIIVEVGTTEEIFNTPVHPYTKHLLAAIPKISNQGIGSSYIDDNIKYEYDKIHYDYHVNPPQYHTLENEHTVYLNQREIENYNNYIKSIINTKAKPKTSFTKKAIGEII